MAEKDDVMMSDEPGAALSRCLERALTTMNEAVGMTAEEGPAKAIEYIADFLNNTDAADDEMAKNCPEDWLTRWSAVRKLTADEIDVL